MKLTKCVSIETELELDLTTEDMAALLQQCLDVVTSDREQTRRELLAPLNAVFLTLSAYPEKAIEKLTEADRQIIYSQILPKLERFRPTDA